VQVPEKSPQVSPTPKRKEQEAGLMTWGMDDKKLTARSVKA